jgi:membrane associated rhomboid family serine protease
MASYHGTSPAAAVGASGAIMGLAGMYLILSPTPKVHMVWWWRLGFMWAFRLNYKIFAIRGFWLLILFMAFDILAMLIGADDGIAHWAHLGGFLCGMGLGLLLLITRLVNARGGDLLTAIFGRRAWWLVGKPDTTRRSIIAIV